jgi:hypothetical protein
VSPFSIISEYSPETYPVAYLRFWLINGLGIFSFISAMIIYAIKTA